MTRTTPTVDRLAGSLGAEISGIDLSGELDDDAIAFVGQALLEHLVVFFRDQELTPDDQLRFARYFGEIDRYPMVTGMPGYPDIVEIIKYAHETVNFGGLWHSDTAYLERPPMGSILYAREVPPYGGDTLWANTYQAYETLSDGFKRLLEGLTAIHSSAKADVSKTREDRLADHPPETETPPLYSEHPIVRTHPETGRKALYCSGAHTERIEGMTEAESAPILEYLYQWQIRPEFTCRFRWREGSLAFWDNRCTLHNPINDYHGYRRVMQRITLKGEVPA
jgi:taurine dioxygenase